MKEVEVDITDIINLSTAGMDDLITDLTDIQREITLACWTNIVSGRYPVDTGRSRAAWIATVGKPSLSAPAATKGRNSQKFPSTPSLDESDVDFPNYIVNNVDYTIYLNEGSSVQAPAKFIELAIAMTLAAYN